MERAERIDREVFAGRQIPGRIPVRFMPRDSLSLAQRLGQMLRSLDAPLLRPHVLHSFSLDNGRRSWEMTLRDILKVDFAESAGFPDLMAIIAEIDSLPEGRVLDEANLMMIRLHQEMKKEELPQPFSLLTFLRTPPPESAISSPTVNFDVSEVFVRTLGSVKGYVDMGEFVGIRPEHQPILEQKFRDGYLFLRAASVLSHRV